MRWQGRNKGISAGEGLGLWVVVAHLGTVCSHRRKSVEQGKKQTDVKVAKEKRTEGILSILQHRRDSGPWELNGWGVRGGIWYKVYLLHGIHLPNQH
jgi:hypothetical protein